MIKIKQIVGSVVIIGAIFFITPQVPTADASSTSDVMPSSYGGGAIKLVTICHNDNTINVPPDAVDAHLDHGDTRGVCVPKPRVLGAVTTAEQQQIVNLQKQIIVLLQQLLVLTKSKS